MEYRPLKVLIFSVSIGAGHDSVAKALAQEIQDKSPESQVLIVDTFKYINSILNKVVVGSYMETIKFTPKVWGYLYDQAEEGDKLVDIGQILSKLLSPKLDQLLKDFQPDVLVCSHAFPAGILSVLKARRNFTTPIVACITDFTVHSFWIHPNVDLYIIPGKDFFYHFINEKIDLNKVKPYGIPLRPQFNQQYAKEEVRRKLGLDENLTVLVMGGGLGLGKIEDVVSNLLNKTDYQVLVVAGNNTKLKSSLEKFKKDNHLHIFGYVENVAELMAGADIIVTKPGGVTCAEALAMELPIAIVSSLPGQEDRNTEYFTNKGIAIKIRKVDYLEVEIKRLFNNPLRLKHIREMEAFLKKPDSSLKTVQEIWKLAEKKV